MQEQRHGVTIHTGDALQVLKRMPAESVHCVVSSPPYWLLRDYGVDGQIGLEPSIVSYVKRIRAVFRQVQRVLRKDGSLWVNMGDSYAGGGRGHSLAGSTLEGTRNNQAESRAPKLLAAMKERRGSNVPAGYHQRACEGGAIGRAWSAPPKGMASKCLVGMPWRVAFALQADGWILREDIIWQKPNCMPESCRDRCTRSHEYLFHFTRRAQYWWDPAAMFEPCRSSAKDLARARVTGRGQQGASNAGLGAPRRDKSGGYPAHDAPSSKQDGHSRRHAGFNARWDANEMASNIRKVRNRRSVWSVATAPYKGAHYATFPPDLVEPCISASCPPNGIVLDPFAGSGTTLAVALHRGRRAIGIELNPGSVVLAWERVDKTLAKAPLFIGGGMA